MVFSFSFLYTAALILLESLFTSLQFVIQLFFSSFFIWIQIVNEFIWVPYFARA